jgi:hypothetical protein
MAPTNREANIVFKIDGANQSRQEVDKVRKAFEDFGDEGKKSAQKVVDATEGLQRGIDKVEKKITQGKLVTVRDVAEMRVNYERFGDAVEDVFGSIANAPQELQKAHKLAADQLERVRVEAVKTAKAMEDQKAVTNEAGAAYRGLGKELQEASGKFGGAAASFGLGMKAMSEGWQIGTQVAKAIGTDFTAMNGFIEEATVKMRTLNTAVIDLVNGQGSFSNLRASIALNKAELEGFTSAQLAGIKGIGDYKNHTAEFNKIAELHNSILKEGAEGQRLATQAKRDANGDLENYVVALNVASDAAKVHNDLLKKGEEGQRLWNEVKEKGKGNLVDLAQAISDYRSQIDQLVRKTDEQVAAERRLQTALNDTTALTKVRGDQDQQQAELINRQTQSENALVDQIRAKIAEIQASISAQKENLPLTQLQIKQLQELLNLGPQLTASERAAIAALVEKLKTIETMSGVEKEGLKIQMQHLDILPKVATATSGLAEGTIKWSNAAKDGKLTADEAAKAMAALKEKGTDVAGKGLEELEKRAGTLVQNLATINTELLRTKGILVEVGDEAAKAGKKLELASKAGMDDSGGAQ